MKLSDLAYFGRLSRTAVTVTAYIAFFVMCGVMSSCGSDKMYSSPIEWGLKEKERDVFLTLDVALPDNLAAPLTRAQGEGTTDLDYFEDPDNICETLQTLRVIIMKANDADVSEDESTADVPPTMEVEHNRLVKMRSDGVVYDGSLRFLTTPGQKKIYLIGNEAGLPEDFQNEVKAIRQGESILNSEIEQKLEKGILDSEIAYNADGAANFVVPMSEIFTVNVREVMSDEDLEQTATLFITRALSKFSFQFKMTSDTPGNLSFLQVKKVKISGLGKSEYIFPTGTVYDPVKGQPSDYDLHGRYITTFDLPDPDEELTEYEFTIPDGGITLGTVAEGKNYLFAPKIYFPESKGTPQKNEEGELTGVRDFYCTISFDGVNYLDPVALPNLSALPRNTHVKVLITLTPQKLSAKVEVAPYNIVKLRPVFGDDKEEDSEKTDNSGESGDNGGNDNPVES